MKDFSLYAYHCYFFLGKIIVHILLFMLNAWVQIHVGKRSNPGGTVKTQAIENIISSLDTMYTSTDLLSNDFLAVLAKLEDTEIHKRLLKDLIEKVCRS